MNKTIKKIVALGVGVTMFAGTAAIAVLGATDLSSYPAPFVQNGVFQGKIVIGEKAAAIDTIGALDIAASLQRDAATTVTGSEGTTQVQGGFRLDTSSNRVYLGESFGVDSVTKDNLDILKDNQFEDSEGTNYDYTQSVVFLKNSNLLYSQHSQSSVDGFYAFDLDNSVSTSNYLYQEKVDFTKTLNATSSIVVGQKIVLFGNEYTFSSESSGNKLVLYGSSQEVSLTPKDEVTQTIDGKEYKINVIGFGTSGTTARVIVSVNGVSDNIAEGSSKTINGLKIYAKSVSSWNNGVDGFAKLQLGAQKLTLEHGKKVSVGTSDTNIDATLVQISSSATNKVEGISSIQVYVNADNSDHKYIAEGEAFSDKVFKSFKISYENSQNGLTSSTRDTMVVRPSGQHRAYVKVTPVGGTEASVFFDYDGALKWEQTRTIFPVENATAAQDDYVYLTPNSASDARYTHLVRVSDITLDSTKGSVSFEDALTGTQYKTVEGAFDTNGEILTATIDGKDYKVYLNDATASAPKIAVAYGTDVVIYPAQELKGGEWYALTAPVTGLSIPAGTVVLTPTGTLTTPNLGTGASTLLSGSLNSAFNYTVTYNNATHVTTGITVQGQTLPGVLFKEKKDFNSAENVVFVPTVYTADGVDIGTPTFTGANSGSVSMLDDNTNSWVDYFGTFVSRYAPSSKNAVVVTVTTPTDQLYANVFIAPLTAQATTTGASGAVALNPIAVGLAILDKDATLGSKPYIVVGGPCANTVAAALMSNPANCVDGFVEGKAKIKLYADQNALLVAGFSAQDTQGASRVLAYYKDYKDKFTGTELEVITSNLASLSVNKVQ